MQAEELRFFDEKSNTYDPSSKDRGVERAAC
jgi:hypothetical protein